MKCVSTFRTRLSNVRIAEARIHPAEDNSLFHEGLCFAQHFGELAIDYRSKVLYERHNILPPSRPYAAPSALWFTCTKEQTSK